MNIPDSVHPICNQNTYFFSGPTLNKCWQCIRKHNKTANYYNDQYVSYLTWFALSNITKHQVWGLLSQFSPFRYFPSFSELWKEWLPEWYQVHIWQVSPQLRCGDTWQIWTWFKVSNLYFCKIKISRNGELNERSFSNHHPRRTNDIEICIANFLSLSYLIHLGNIVNAWYCHHYNDVTMDSIASQITSLTIAHSTVYSGADQRKHQSSAPLAFVRGIHRGPVNSPHKWPVTRKMFPFDDVIMMDIKDYPLDPQLYIAFKPSDETSKYDAISQIEACVADTRVWMNGDFFKSNDDKTEILIITTHG